MNRYYHLPAENGMFYVKDRLDPASELPVALLHSADSARVLCESLNRGLVESVTPDGRWTEEATA